MNVCYRRFKDNVILILFSIFQVAKAYLEIFELPEVQGVLFFQTVVNHVSSINKE